MASRDFSKVGNTAFSHIYFRTFYGIPYAVEMYDLMGGKERIDQTYAPEANRAAIIPIMEARYKGGAAALEALIKENPQAWVLELAAGFSIHGAVLVEKYPGIQYFETDYSAEIIALKEDLLSYLTRSEMEQLSGNIISLLRRFGGAWVTPDPAFPKERRDRLLKEPGLQGKAEEMAGQRYDDHGFLNEQDADDFFTSQGFSIRKLPQPTDLNSFRALNLSAEIISRFKVDIRQHGKVWLLELAK